MALRLVGKHDNARTEVLVCTSLRGVVLLSWTGFGEKLLADAQDDRKDHQPILIDQAVLPQGMDEIGAATQQNILARLLLDSGDFFRDVRLNQR
jgi:hypothetical protein